MHCSHSALANTKVLCMQKHTMNIHVWAWLVRQVLFCFVPGVCLLPLQNAIQVLSEMLRSIELSQEKINVWRILQSAVHSNQSDCKVSIVAAD